MQIKVPCKLRELVEEYAKANGFPAYFVDILPGYILDKVINQGSSYRPEEDVEDLIYKRINSKEKPDDMNLERDRVRFLDGVKNFCEKVSDMMESDVGVSSDLRV